MTDVVSVPARRAPRPRDAATLILVRRDDGPPRILMGRRSGGHDFMPGKWVFPGGRVDRADFAVPAASELTADTLAALCQGATASRARALALAAVRELWEETGLVLGVSAPPTRTRGQWRGFLATHRPVLDGLAYIARAITPPARHKRFDARFFLADAADLTSLEPQSNGELDELAWFDLKQCRALDLPAVTRAVLDVAESRGDGVGKPIPFWRWTRGNPGSAL